MEQEMRIAAEIQQALLPQGRSVPAMFFKAAAASLPCRSIGGDFYDYVDLPNGRARLRARRRRRQGAAGGAAERDDAGHVRGAGGVERSPSQTVTRANLALYRRGIESRFVTLMYGALHPDGRLTVLQRRAQPAAGHRAETDSSAASNAAGRSSGCSRARRYDEETVTLEPRRLADRLQRRRLRGALGRRRGVRRGRGSWRACEKNLEHGAAGAARGAVRRRPGVRPRRGAERRHHRDGPEVPVIAAVHRRERLAARAAGWCSALAASGTASTTCWSSRGIKEYPAPHALSELARPRGTCALVTAASRRRRATPRDRRSRRWWARR